VQLQQSQHSYLWTARQGPGTRRLSGLLGAAPTSEIYGASPLPDGSKDRRERYDITWTSDDSGGKLFAYYKAQLAQGDWVEQSTSGDPNRGGLIVFNRKSSTTWGGSILLADGKIHVIMGDGCPCGVPT
jgi:hypothetical protein